MNRKKHTCHAIGCEKPVPPKLLMCGPHWRKVPMDLRRAVWRAYRPGQEQDKRPSIEYVVAQLLACEFVARHEGLHDEADRCEAAAAMYFEHLDEDTWIAGIFQRCRVARELIRGVAR